MADNLAEKVDECIDYVQLEVQKLSIIRSSEMSAIQGLLKYWTEWRDIQDFRDYSLYRGCPLLRGVC